MRLAGLHINTKPQILHIFLVEFRQLFMGWAINYKSGPLLNVRLSLDMVMCCRSRGLVEIRLLPMSIAVVHLTLVAI
jgi:hypothetical protein